MSLETPPEVGVAPKGNTPGSSHVSGNKDETSCSTFATFSNSHRIVLDHVNEAALAVASQEEITASSTLGPREKERQQRGNLSPAVEESSEARLERLGRQRPDAFDSIWAEIGFVFSISMSQVLSVSQHSNGYRPIANDCQEYFVSGFTVILPTLVTDLHIPAASSTWPASAFSLTVASFLLIFGRVADMKGGYPVYVAGLAWLTVWSLIAGFSVNDIMLNFCRALQGLGPAAFLPSGVMILGSTYRPGPRKNLIFSIYGSCAATGFFVSPYLFRM